MIPATVLLGSMAAGGLGLYLSGSTGSAPSTGIVKNVEDAVSTVSEQVTEQVSKTAEQVTDLVRSDEPAPEPAPEPLVQEQPVAPVAEIPVEVQRGGFGRPTWAPVNSGTSLTQALGVVPGTPAGNVLATATGSKTPQQIQQELVSTEQQIRELKTNKFLKESELTDEESAYKDAVKSYREAENTKYANQQYLAYYEREIKKIQNPERETAGDSLYGLLLSRFPERRRSCQSTGI